MTRSNDPLALSPHWHVDCRIEADLPEDNVVGTRFIINILFAAVAFAALLFTGWLGFVNISLRHQIRDWEQRISDNRAEVRDIQRMQREYAVEAAKIDQAHALVSPHFFVTGFVASIGRTRPDQLAIDTIDWNDAGIVVRGSVQERSERATRLLGAYVEKLRGDKEIGALFREVSLTDLARESTDNTIKFELVFRLKPAKS